MGLEKAPISSLHPERFLNVQSKMRRLIETVVRDYSWIHRGLGLIGNIAFLVGSVAFLPEFKEFKTAGVWLFIVGASLMLIGATGHFLVDLYESH